MQIIEVQFTPWDQSYYFKPEDSEGRLLDLKKGDEVILKTTVGTDLGKVKAAGELSQKPEGIDEIKPVIRKATAADQLKYLELNKNRLEKIEFCRSLIKKYKMDMKLVDVHTSFDNQRLVFAFIADGRIDFRELVKELTRKYSITIRMQQIGVRDEAKFRGDIGQCGKTLCCRTHLKELGNVTTDFAKCQQVAHRGSERLSGVCDRLKCCLRYEQPIYEELAKKFPALGTTVKTEKGAGVVVSWHTLKGTIDVNIGDEKNYNIVEVPIK